MSKKPKTHYRDTRLRNNGGMDYPTCYANPKSGLLDTDKGRLRTTGNLRFVTCKRCLIKLDLRYPWIFGYKADRFLKYVG